MSETRKSEPGGAAAPKPDSALSRTPPREARPDLVGAAEETEGATGALETPATPPVMSKHEKTGSNRRQ